MIFLFTLAAATAELPCTIHVHRGPLTLSKFMELRAAPFIHALDRRVNAEFAAMATRNSLLTSHGSSLLRISTAESYTGRSWTLLSFREYVDGMVSAENSSGSETLYFFGSHHEAEWSELLEIYSQPPGVQYADRRTLSFGVAGMKSGVPFHGHGAAWGEVLLGKKRWFLAPPDTGPSLQFDPTESTHSWVTNVLPTLNASKIGLRQCVAEPGDVIYIPSGWEHATLNLANWTAFISVFV